MKSLSNNSPSVFLNREGHLHEEAIALYVDALRLQQVEQLPAELVEHVAGCFLCKEAVFTLCEVLPESHFENLGAHPFFDKPEAVKQDWIPRLLRLAAVFVVGAIAIYTLAQLREQQAPQLVREQSHPLGADSVNVTTRDTTRLQTPAFASEELYAANFATAPDLESLLEDEIRAEDFEVLAPKNGSVFRGQIKFIWKGGEGSDLQLQVLSNREEIVFDATHVRSPFLFSKKLTPGLYYWKLTTSEELLFVGKFLVKTEP